MRHDADQVHKKTDLSDDLIKIALGKGFISSENRASGNCLFYALSEQLEHVKGILVSHQELRGILVQFLRETANLVSQYSESDFSQLLINASNNNKVKGFF